MHSYKASHRTLAKALRPRYTLINTHRLSAPRHLSKTSQNMAVFQRSMYGEDPTFTNLFRMLDDFANYSRDAQGSQINNNRHARQRLINPKFDVRETEKTYELHGELPGIDRENIQIEFTEPQTISIRGRVERNYTTGTPPTSALENTQMSGAITEGTEASHKGADAAKEKSGATTAVVQQERNETPERHYRYWHQERSIGEFHRTFSFPTNVDESAVKANLDKGILHVTVPKASKPAARRINIE